ncbi:MAG: cell division protein FtsA [Alphaproteobacteria bacterium]|nr:MAG: cell division protein FtsA [Alphaproteobacteria bacterium]
MRWLFGKHKGQSRAELISSIDIGSSRISCAIAEIDADNGLRVLGMGHHSSDGIRGGVITNMEHTKEAISKAVMHAEKQSRESIRNVFINVPSPHVFSHGIDVEMPIHGAEVTNEDISQLLSQASKNLSPVDKEIIHAIPSSYYIDGSHGIKDPKGMVGDVLGAKIHLVSSTLGPLRNWIACVEQCHMDVQGVVAAPFAAGIGVLDDDEIDLGTVVIDMGASNTGIAIFAEGSLLQLSDVPIGGNHISRDLARAFSTPISHAERVKCLYGSTIVGSSLERETIIIPIIGEQQSSSGSQVSRSSLTRVIKPRMEEIFEHVRERLRSLGVDQIPGCRIVLTGGGCLLSGTAELAQAILARPVRVGYPLHLQGLNKEYTVPYLAACAGILSYVRLQQNQEESDHRPSSPSPRGLLQNIFQKLRERL